MTAVIRETRQATRQAEHLRISRQPFFIFARFSLWCYVLVH
jgi:hypothetical protein